MVKERKPSPEVQLATKILLAKSLIKNWDKFSHEEKIEIEQWWKEIYGEFKE